MSRPPLLLSSLAVAGALVCMLVSSAAPAATSRAITLEYTTAGVLLVMTDDGATIRTSAAPGAVVSPGPYQVIVNDDMPDSKDVQHGFRLQGPGVNLQTDMASGDNKTELYDVVLAPSSVYTFADDRQPALPHVVFSTASSAAAAAGSSGTTPVGSSSGTSSNTPVVGSEIRKALPYRGNLAASVATGGKLQLAAGGTPVVRLRAGRYKLTVDDRTANAGFTVKGPATSAIAVTGTRFVGRRSLTLTFRAGEWLFYSPSGRKSSFTVIT